MKQLTKMKKLIIVNNNLEIGGIQKSLVNLLHAVKDDFDITLLLFNKAGDLIKEVPEGIKIETVSSDFKYLGMSQAKCGTLKDKIKRALYVLRTRIYGFGKAAEKLCRKQEKVLNYYDAAISFQQCAREKSFYGGTAEFVLNCINAAEKICFIHCDYLQSGTACVYNNGIYRRFDKIACVSQSVKNKFLHVLPELSDNTFVVRNCNQIDYIRKKAKEEPFSYDNKFINILSVSRLAEEKGIERVITGLAESGRTDIRFYILGEGPMKSKLSKTIDLLKVDKQVFLLGQDVNPYRYMEDADYLILPSYHEAAPMVFDEAKILGVPILTTETTSAHEMVVADNAGEMCDNSQQGITKMLSELCKRQKKYDNIFTNDTAVRQFKSLIH